VSPDQVRRVLEERARALARPPEDQADDDTLELVVLAVGAERYGIDVRLVREVRPLAGLAPVPGMPACWAGLVNLRGSLCPVLSLRRYLGGGDDPDPDRDGVLRPPPTAPHDRAHAAVQAVTPDLLQLLDPGALLADPALVVGRDAT
jgi:hypothetical protein